MTARRKFYCPPCDEAAKAQGAAACPRCGTAMRDMGTRWRPGRRGTRTRLWDRRQESGNIHPTSFPASPDRVGRKRARWQREQPKPVSPPYVPWWRRR
jgi:hypothetical protein